MNQTKKRKQTNNPTDNHSNTIRAPGHYEQKDSFILYKFYDLQSSKINLKSVEDFKKECKRDSITIEK